MDKEKSKSINWKVATGVMNALPPVATSVLPEVTTSAPFSPFSVMADTLNVYKVSGVSW